MGEMLPVYVIHWNAPDWCRAAVASLAASAGVDVDITVVDNNNDGDGRGDGRGDGGGSSDGAGTRSPIDLGTAARVIPTGANLGYTGAANVALDDWRARHPDAAYAVVASHDLIVAPATLATMVAAAEAHPAHGVFGPAFTDEHRALAGDGTVADREWVTGACLLIRRGCADAVGGFDTSFGSYVEDVDFCARARDAGWRVGLVPAARAGERGAASDRSLEYIIVNSVRLSFKRRGTRAGWLHIGRVAVGTATTAATSMAPWRSAARRAESLRFFHANARALATIARELARGRSAWRGRPAGGP